MTTISFEATCVLHTSALKVQHDTEAATRRLRSNTAVMWFCMRNGVLSQVVTATLRRLTDEQGESVLERQMHNYPPDF